MQSQWIESCSILFMNQIYTSEWGSEWFQEEDCTLWRSVPDPGWEPGAWSELLEDLQLWEESVSVPTRGPHTVQDCLLSDEPSCSGGIRRWGFAGGEIVKLYHSKCMLHPKKIFSILNITFKKNNFCSLGQYTCAATARASTTLQAGLVETVDSLNVAGLEKHSNEKELNGLGEKEVQRENLIAWHLSDSTADNLANTSTRFRWMALKLYLWRKRELKSHPRTSGLK